MYGRRKMLTKFRWGTPERKIPLGKAVHTWKIILKSFLRNWVWRLWTRLIWLKMGVSGRLL